MTWVLSAALNLVIAVCYFGISGLILRGSHPGGGVADEPARTGYSRDLQHLRGAPRAAHAAHARADLGPRQPDGFGDARGVRLAFGGVGHGRRRSGPVLPALRLADLALYEAKRRGNRVVNAPVALAGQPD